MVILYVGKNEYGAYPAEQIAKQKEWTFIRFSFLSDEPVNLKYTEQDILAYNFNKVIFDLSDIENTEEEIVEVINNVKLAKACDVIIFAPRFNTKSRMVMSLQSFGIEYFVFGEKNQGLIREEMYAALNGEVYHEQTEPEKIIANREEIASKAGIITNENYAGSEGTVKRIAVVGGMKHIGSTTTALQIVKHLNLNEENSACYIQSDRGLIESLKEFFPSSIKDFCGGYIFKETVMFGSTVPSPSIISKGFKFLVYDYGSIADADKTVMLDRDIIIAVNGTKPEEIGIFKTEILPLLYNNCVANYIFNFTPTSDRKGILGMMGKKREHAFFLEYTPDPFVYNIENKDSFDRIMATVIAPDIKARKFTKRRRRLFGR